MSTDDVYPNSPAAGQPLFPDQGVYVSTLSEDEEEEFGPGMLRLTAKLSIDQATAVWNAVDGRARLLHQKGDERTMDQLRADVLVETIFERARALGIEVPE
jgi:hypothetical protein